MTKLTQDEIFERKLFVKLATHKSLNEAERSVGVYRRLFAQDVGDENAEDSASNTHKDDHDFPDLPDVKPVKMPFVQQSGRFERKPFTVPWDTAPEWANYAAYDKVRGWQWKEGRPTMVGNLYYGYGKVEEFTAPPFPGDWKDSLQRRPDNV